MPGSNVKNKLQLRRPAPYSLKQLSSSRESERAWIKKYNGALNTYWKKVLDRLLCSQKKIPALVIIPQRMCVSGLQISLLDLYTSPWNMQEGIYTEVEFKQNKNLDIDHYPS